MIIQRIFNNNIALVLNQNEKQMIVTGKGIAFNKKTGDKISESDVDQKFVLEVKGANALDELMKDISVEYIELTNEIISMAAQNLKVIFHSSIFLGLIDHISYAISRYKQDIAIKNVLLWEIKKFYSKEFETALLALRLIDDKFDILLPEDEAGFLAVHFVNAQQDGEEMHNTLKITKLVNDILNIVNYQYGIELDENSLHYTRFITHIRFFARRLFLRELNTSSDDDYWYERMKEKDAKAFKCALKIKAYLESKYNMKVLKEEMVYFMMHINRVTAKNIKS